MTPLVEVKQTSSREDSVISLRERKSEQSSHRDYAEPHDLHFGKHRWDPDMSWTAEEERRLVRKTDLRLLGFFCVILICIAIDKHNLSNALTDNFLKDTKLTSTDYDNCLTLSRIGVLLSEFPVQMAVLRFGFRKTFPPLIVCFGIISTCQCLISDRENFLAMRFLIGIFEGGYSAGMIYFFTQFYVSRELTPRLAALSVMGDFAHILASLCAAGILKMRGLAGKPGWFWLFLIEGSVTFTVGILSYLYLPRSPTQTRSAIHPDSWYSKKEEYIMVNHVLRDDPTKGQVATATMPTYRDVLKTWSDKKLWIFYLVGMLGVMSYLPVKQYLSLTLRRLGFTTFQSNMLAVPCAVLQMIMVITVSWSSQKFNERAWHCIAAHFFALPSLVALEVMPPNTGSWQKYSCTLFIVGAPTYSPIVISWLSQSAFSVKKRAIALTTYSTSCLLGGIVASQIYQKRDGPHYHKGNKVLIVVATMAGGLFVVQRYILAGINRSRQKSWDNMTVSDQDEYRKVTEHMEFDGNKRLDFRFPL
ncbi:MFS general substrate transporter [Myriangium duriaei CBS 260.36]|uniref:MFS general substrate transporter n=1 Tax=Myriangium duriaei CBS 260.36 TaxID=1168546 RepID=A0A9P4MFE2_9PEZI|nr:MFS general substrate transporter [Myriangium duriaei CBS 260.36]